MPNYTKFKLKNVYTFLTLLIFFTQINISLAGPDNNLTPEEQEQLRKNEALKAALKKLQDDELVERKRLEEEQSNKHSDTSIDYFTGTLEVGMQLHDKEEQKRKKEEEEEEKNRALKAKLNALQSEEFYLREKLDIQGEGERYKIESKFMEYLREEQKRKEEEQKRKEEEQKRKEEEQKRKEENKRPSQIIRFKIDDDKCPLIKKECCNKCCLDKDNYLEELKEIGRAQTKKLYGDKDFYMSRWVGEGEIEHIIKNEKMLEDQYYDRMVTRDTVVGSGAYMVMQRSSEGKPKDDDAELMKMIIGSAEFTKENGGGYFSIINANKAHILSRDDKKLIDALNRFGYGIDKSKKGDLYYSVEKNHRNNYRQDLDTHNVSFNLFYITCQNKLREEGIFIPNYYSSPDNQGPNERLYGCLQSPKNLASKSLSMDQIIKDKSCKEIKPKLNCQCNFIDKAIEQLTPIKNYYEDMVKKYNDEESIAIITIRINGIKHALNYLKKIKKNQFNCINFDAPKYKPKLSEKKQGGTFKDLKSESCKKKYQDSMKKLENVIAKAVFQIKEDDNDSKSAVDLHLDKLMNAVKNNAKNLSHKNRTKEPKLKSTDQLAEQFKLIRDKYIPGNEYGYTPRDSATLAEVINNGNARERLNLFYEYSKGLICNPEEVNFFDNFLNSSFFKNQNGCLKGQLQDEIEGKTKGKPFVRQDTISCPCNLNVKCKKDCDIHTLNKGLEFNQRIESALGNNSAATKDNDIYPPFSDREKKALKTEDLVLRANGSMFRIPKKCENNNCHEYTRTAEEGGFPQVAGLSGTTTMLLASQQYFGLNSQRDKELTRLALLGWMINSGDHSAYEIMRASQSYGLDFNSSPDYYKNLIPSDPILNTKLTNKIKELFGKDELPDEIITTCQSEVGCEEGQNLENISTCNPGVGCKENKKSIIASNIMGENLHALWKSTMKILGTRLPSLEK
jgi:hypothetical protein